MPATKKGARNMTFLQMSPNVTTVLVLLGLGGLALGAEKDTKGPDKDQAQGTVHTVQAGVGYPTNAGSGIQAEKQPGDFTIPKGSTGTKLKYSFSDPKTGFSSTKLRGSNIYSVTEKRYMHELDKTPDVALPPGDYRFVVGGSPGATGTLSYTTVPSSGTNQAPKPPVGPKSPPGHSSPPAGFPKAGGKEVLLSLPRDFDVAVPDLSPLPHVGEAEKAKTPIVLRFRGQSVTCSYEHSMPPNDNGFPSQMRGTLTISGVFHRGQLSGSATYHVFNRDTRQEIDFFQYKAEAQVKGQANADGRLTITMQWKPTNWQARTAGTRVGDGPIPWGQWKDCTQEYMSTRPPEVLNMQSRFTVQLPVGQLQSSQKPMPQ